MPKTKVLVVDDFAPFRRLVRMILQMASHLEVVGEAADGLEAVQQAVKLRPDVILLDLDMPKLNGFQSARRIRDILPQAKSLFISVESSAEVVEEALKLGAGYIHKLNTARQLLPAFEVILKGEQFISDELRPSAIEADSTNVSRHRKRTTVQAPNFHHEVAFYATNGLLVAGFARFIGTTLERGNVAIEVTTTTHHNEILRTLHARGLQTAHPMQTGRYTRLDSLDTLSLFVSDDWPDPARFSQAVGGLIKTAAELAKERHRRVAVCGELAPILWAKGNRNAAIEIERLWDDMCAEYQVDTLCGYVSATLDRDKHPRQFDRICAAHSTVYFR